MAIYFRPLILTAGRNKSAYFSRRDDSKLTSNKTLSQLYIDRDAAEKAIKRYKQRYPMDEIVYSEIEEIDGSRESNPIRPSSKDPSDMSAAEINRELDRISAEDSKVNQELIDAGRGHEKYLDVLKKDDPLSRKALALTSRRHKLKIEIERRAGPGMSRLPRGFGPRKSNPMKKRANDLTAQAMEGYNGEPLKYLYSSPSWYAYKIGEHFRTSGRSEPSDVRMGRGYSINVRDMTFSFGKHDAITRVK